MTWFVVRFDEEDTVEAVPNIWYMKKKSKCFWPPDGTIKTIIIDFIKKKHLPETNWILHKASILGVYDDYKKAQQKANKAKDTNILSSNNEDLKDKCKRKKKNRICYNESDNEHELSTDKEIEISSDDETYPDLPTELNIESSDRMRVENNTDKNSQFRDTTNIATTTSASSNTTIKTALLHHKLDLNSQPISEKEFEKRVMRELHIITLKIDDISESLNTLLKNKAEESQKSVVCNNVPDIIQSFPVNQDSLAQLENWLSCEENNKTKLAQNLSLIGGCNVKDIVRRIMYHVFTNEVGMSYSWEGAKKKKVFKNLAVASVILSAVRLNKKNQECTDSEIIYYIKAWLVRSKDRFNNKNKNKDITPQRIEETENSLINNEN